MTWTSLCVDPFSPYKKTKTNNKHLEYVKIIEFEFKCGGGGGGGFFPIKMKTF